MKIIAIPFTKPDKTSRTVLMLLFCSTFLIPVKSKEQIKQVLAVGSHTGHAVYVNQMLPKIDDALQNGKLKFMLFQSLRGINEQYEEVVVNSRITHQPIRILVD